MIQSRGRTISEKRFAAAEVAKLTQNAVMRRIFRDLIQAAQGRLQLAIMRDIVARCVSTGLRWS